MKKNAWHIVHDNSVMTLSRRLPARFDLCAETTLPLLRRRALAHEVRKDVWRLLKDLRGFAPAVEVAQTADGLRVRAGGAVDGPVPCVARTRLTDLLDSTAHRARWCRHARVAS
ncbi:hypothetical protein [Meridianimarinicoccus aquatilis]|nr:hypothetical protein [Fluviibacterium aquatile]